MLSRVKTMGAPTPCWQGGKLHLSLEISLDSPQTLKVYLSYDLDILLLDIYPKDSKSTHHEEIFTRLNYVANLTAQRWRDETAKGAHTHKEVFKVLKKHEVSHLQEDGYNCR